MKQLVFPICLLFTLFLLSPVLLTLFKTPANTVNMMVGHYFEDYYEYLSFVREGQEGKIFLSNLFTTEDKSTFLAPWWPYSVLGFLSFSTHINVAPALLYWLCCAVFIFTFFILNFIAIHYFLVKKSDKASFCVFILIMLASSFFTISSKAGFTVVPFDFWYSIGSPFARFNVGTPHHQLTHTVFLLGLILLASQVKEKPSLRLYIGFFLVSLLLLLLSPPQLTLFWLSYLASSLVFFALAKSDLAMSKFDFSRIKIFLPLVVSLIFLTPMAYLLYRFSFASPTYLSARMWDIQNMYYPPISLFVLSTGPLLVLALLGLPVYFSKITPQRLLLFFVCLFSFLLILLPLNIFSFDVLKLLGFHNLRFATPASYIFLGVAAVEFLQRIFKKKIYTDVQLNCNRYNRSYAPSRYHLGIELRSVYFTIIFVFIILFFLPSLFSYWQSMKKGPYSAGFLQFMPQEIYLGVKMLETQKDRLAVLTSPSSHLGLVTPSISGRKVYLGRSIFTLNFEEKAKTSAKFYSLQMSEEEARRFLKEEGIGYVLVSDIDGAGDKLQSHYRFLEPLWQNSRLTVFMPKGR